VGYGACGDIGEVTQRGGSTKGVQGRGGKEACCCIQGGEGEEAECVRRAKAAMEENPDTQRKGKWPCCTQ
jgi:hypothetical protein